jgi:hypothetical protein
MHHSKDPARRSFVPANYIDDSGEESAQFSLMGGPVFSQTGFFDFHYQWGRIADSHQIELPIHMKEFARPDGRLAYVSDHQRRSLFVDLVHQINRNKIYSVTVVVNNNEFSECFPSSVYKGYMSPSAYAFLWCLLLNYLHVKQAQDRDGICLDPMAYIVAESDFNTQLMDCYTFWRSCEKYEESEHTGSITLGQPKSVYALQAADMVAWANLRKHRGLPFDKGFEPLELLTQYVESDVKPNIHYHFPVDKESAQRLAGILGSPSRKKGKRESLLGAISPALLKHVARLIEPTAEDTNAVS